MSAHIQPGDAAPDHFDTQLALLQVGPVDLGDLELAALRRLQAANYVQAVEDRQGMMIACPEEIAYRMDFIDAEQLRCLAERYRSNQYGAYLLSLLEDDVHTMGY